MDLGEMDMGQGYGNLPPDVKYDWHNTKTERPDGRRIEQDECWNGCPTTREILGKLIDFCNSCFHLMNIALAQMHSVCCILPYSCNATDALSLICMLISISTIIGLRTLTPRTATMLSCKKKSRLLIIRLQCWILCMVAVRLQFYTRQFIMGIRSA